MAVACFILTILMERSTFYMFYSSHLKGNDEEDEEDSSSDAAVGEEEKGVFNFKEDMEIYKEVMRKVS